MGIYMNGMEMSKTDGETKKEIWLFIRSDGVVAKRTDGHFKLQKATAVEVPHHGRLIDADLLYDAMLLRNGNRFAKMFKSDWLDIMPTIIEAEEWHDAD